MSFSCSANAYDKFISRLPGIGNRARVIVTEDMEKVICQAENSAGTGRKSVDIIIKVTQNTSSSSKEHKLNSLFSFQHEKGGSTGNIEKFKDNSTGFFSHYK